MMIFKTWETDPLLTLFQNFKCFHRPTAKFDMHQLHKSFSSVVLVWYSQVIYICKCLWNNFLEENRPQNCIIRGFFHNTRLISRPFVSTAWNYMPLTFLVLQFAKLFRVLRWIERSTVTLVFCYMTLTFLIYLIHSFII